jgi:hypothetical protein
MTTVAIVLVSAVVGGIVAIVLLYAAFLQAVAKGLNW